MMIHQAHRKVMGSNHLNDAIGVPEIRNREEEKAVGLEHARDLLHDCTIVWNVLGGFGTDSSVESGIAIGHPSRVGLGESHVTGSGLSQAQKVESEINAVNLFAHRGDLAGIARMSAAAYIENGFEPV